MISSFLYFFLLVVQSIVPAIPLPADPVISLRAEAIKEETVETSSPVVIVGGGVGALTSALYLSRAGIEPIVLEGSNPGGLITQSHLVGNWPGEMEISGADLVDKMRMQAIANGAEFLAEELVAADFSKRPFSLTVRKVDKPNETRQIYADTCIIAMGTQSNYLHIPGETGPNGYWGKGVSNCAVCDGTFYRDQIVGIVGGGDAAVLEALYLSQIAKEVNIFVRKDHFRAIESDRLETLLSKPNVHVFYETEVKEIKGNEKKLTHVVLQSKGKPAPFDFPLDGLFLAIGSRPNTQIFQKSLKLDQAGYISLLKDQETSISGVYAIGDIVDPVYKQAISAAGDGAKAAIQVQKYLSDRKNGLVAKRKKSPTPVQVVQVETAVSKSGPKFAANINTKEIGVIEIKSKEQFDREIEVAKTPVFVDFYANWCKPCKRVTPLFEHSASQFSGKVKFLKVNVDKFYALSQTYQITAMPTVLVLDAKGSVLDRRVGPEEIADLLQTLDTQIE